MKLDSNHYYRILSREKRLALEVDEGSTEDGALIKLQTASGDHSQQWKAVYFGNYFKLINRQSGKALDLCLAGIENGTWVHQWDDVADADSQLWSMQNTEFGLVKIQSKKAGRCLDITDAEPGVILQIWEDVGGFHQQWSFEETGETINAASETKTAQETAPAKPESEKAQDTAAPAAAAADGSETEAKQTVKEAPAAKTAAPAKSKAAPAKKPARSVRKKETKK